MILIELCNIKVLVMLTDSSRHLMSRLWRIKHARTKSVLRNAMNWKEHQQRPAAQTIFYPGRKKGPKCAASEPRVESQTGRCHEFNCYPAWAVVRFLDQLLLPLFPTGLWAVQRTTVHFYQLSVGEGESLIRTCLSKATTLFSASVSNSLIN